MITKREKAAEIVNEIIRNYSPERRDELTKALNSDEYNQHLLAECKKQAQDLIKTGKYAHVIYGLKRHDIELRYFVPCVIPMTKKQYEDAILNHARVLAIHANHRPVRVRLSLLNGVRRLL